MKSFVALLVLTGFSSQILAQDFPSPEPTDAHRVLAKDEGTWDCKGKMFVQGPDGPPMEFKGVETNRMVSGGLHVISEFKAEFGGAPFEGHGLMGFDPRTKEYTGTWVDNFTAVPTAMTGTYDSEKKQMTMRSTVFDAASGEVINQKQVTTYVDEKTKTFDIYMVLDIGGEEMDIKLMSMTAKKRG